MTGFIRKLRCRRGHRFAIFDLDKERGGGPFFNGYKETRCTRCGYVSRRWQDW